MIASGNLAFSRNWGTINEGRYSFSFLFQKLYKDELLLQNFEKFLGVHRRIDVLDKVSN
jgi:hypothetical protein